MTPDISPISVQDLIEAGDLVIGDGYRAKNDELANEGFPFARAQNIDSGFNFEGADRFPEANLGRVSNKVSQPGDVVFTSKGTVGRFAFVREDTPRFVYSPQLCFWRSLNRDRIDPRWLFYWMQSQEFYSQYKGVSGQTDMAEYVSLRDQRSMFISLPELENQHAIAHILGTLDDKIELNRRMNETLEATARAIFKSWFVDFDPVRAKASGEPTDSTCRRLDLTPDLLALFPDSFQDSDLGKIPAGWAAVLLGSLCSRVSMGPFGSDIKTDNFVEVGVPVVRGGNLTDGFVDEGFVFVSEEKADQLRNANAKSGDIVVTHRGTLGQVGLIPKESRYPRYVVSQSQMVLSINPNLSSPQYVFEFLRSPIGQHRLLANASQVGVPAIARPTTSAKAILIVSPCMELLRAFERLVEPMSECVVANTSESRTLATLRDTLLPKLISGEIRASELQW